MKNITLSADADLIEAARRRAATEGTTLNEKFRSWLSDYVGRQRQASRAMRTVHELRGQVRVGTKLTREQMNER